jgi:hypothetical protein
MVVQFRTHAATDGQSPRDGQQPKQQSAEERLVAATADQQKVRTGLIPAPRFLRRLAKAR